MLDFLANLTQPVLLATVDGDIKFINKPCEELFGYTSSELIGKKVEVLIEDHFRDQHIVLRTDFKNNMNFQRMGKRIIHGLKKNGEIVKIGVSLSPSHIDGEFMLTLLIVDYTEIVSYKNEIQELLARKNVKNKTEFFVEHLLKGPFCDIIAQLENSNLKIQDNFKDFFKSVDKLNSHLEEFREAVNESKKTESLVKSNYYDKLLVVDDSESVHSLLNVVAKMNGNNHQLVFAFNGQEAIDKLAELVKEKVLILLDINMPVMDGFEFLEKSNLLNDHDVVMYSSSESKEDLKRAYQFEKVVCFFNKPLKVEEIKNKLLSSLIR